MFPYIFGALFVITGAVPIWLAQRAFAKDRAIAKWPRAPGTITKSTVSSYIWSSKDQQGYLRRYTMYEPVVEFTYTVGDRELQGNKLAREVAASTSQPDLGKYPVGQAVMVYYNPADPSIAFLEIRRSIGAIILTCFGAVFLFVGILVPTLVLSCGVE